MSMFYVQFIPPIAQWQQQQQQQRDYLLLQAAPYDQQKTYFGGHPRRCPTKADVAVLEASRQWYSGSGGGGGDGGEIHPRNRCRETFVRAHYCFVC